jgi:hypothetical protein
VPGRGVFTQAPTAPLEAAIARPGQVENNPAAPTDRTGAPAPLGPSGAAPVQASGSAAPAAAPDKPRQVLRAKFHCNNTLDENLYFKDGFDLNGPWHTQWPAGSKKRYQSINYATVPAGSYALDFAAFDLAPESVKKS